MATTGSERRTIVIGMDGSDYSRHAFQWYIDNVQRKNDHVILLHCPEYHAMLQSPVFMAGGLIAEAEMKAVMEKDLNRARETVGHLGNMLKKSGVEGTVKCCSGAPGEVLVKMADQEHASLIITGTRGMGTVRRTLVGSVSDYITHHSHVPVVVCRHKDHHHRHHGHHHQQSDEQQKQQQQQQTTSL